VLAPGGVGVREAGVRAPGELDVVALGTRAERAEEGADGLAVARVGELDPPADVGGEGADVARAAAACGARAGDRAEGGARRGAGADGAPGPLERLGVGGQRLGVLAPPLEGVRYVRIRERLHVGVPRDLEGGAGGTEAVGRGPVAAAPPFERPEIRED